MRLNRYKSDRLHSINEMCIRDSGDRKLPAGVVQTIALEPIALVREVIRNPDLERIDTGRLPDHSLPLPGQSPVKF